MWIVYCGYIYIKFHFAPNTNWTNHQEIIHQMKFVEFYFNIFLAIQLLYNSQNLRIPVLICMANIKMFNCMYLIWCFAPIFFPFSSHFLLTFTCKRDYEKKRREKKKFKRTFFPLLFCSSKHFGESTPIKKKRTFFEKVSHKQKKKKCLLQRFPSEKKNRQTTENGWTKEFPSFYFIVFTRI